MRSIRASSFTFNYTSTLQNVYGVPDANVLPHSRPGRSAVTMELILGHGWNPAESGAPSTIGAHLEDMDTRLMEGHDIPGSLLSKTFKPSARLIEQNCPFFESATRVEEVLLSRAFCAGGRPIRTYRRLLAIPGMASGHFLLVDRLYRRRVRGGEKISGSRSW